MVDRTIAVDARTYGKLLAVLQVPGSKWTINDAVEAAQALREQLLATQEELLQLKFEHEGREPGCFEHDEREDDRSDQ